MNKNKLTTLILIIIISLLLISSIFLGNQKITYDNFYLLLSLRIPRILGSILIGFILSLTGVVLQTLTRNKIVDASILSINASASMFTVLYFYLLSKQVISSNYLLIIFSIVGAMISVFILVKISKQSGFKLILNAIGIGLIFTSISQMIATKLDNSTLTMYQNWSNGNLSLLNQDELFIMIVITLPFIILIFLNNHVLDRFTLGDSMVRSLGINLVKKQYILYGASALIVSVCVAFVGPISLIGIITPNIIKLINTNQHKYILINSGILGSIILLISDNMSRTLFANSNVSTGLILIILLTPLFLIILLKNNKSI